MVVPVAEPVVVLVPLVPWSDPVVPVVELPMVPLVPVALWSVPNVPVVLPVALVPV